MVKESICLNNGLWLNSACVYPANSYHINKNKYKSVLFSLKRVSQGRLSIWAAVIGRTLTKIC